MGKLGHVAQIRVCQLTQTWCLTSLLRGGGREFPPATMNLAPGYFLQKTEKKNNNKTKEIPICFISRLLVVFTWQLEILATQLYKKTHGVQDHVLSSCSLLLLVHVITMCMRIYDYLNTCSWWKFCGVYFKVFLKINSSVLFIIIVGDRQEESAILISRLLLRMRRVYVASIRLDFH